MAALIEVSMIDTTAYTNRLIKNVRHFSKWARRQGITCYRLYDRDIPEFPVIVDFYENRVHLQEVDTGWVQPEDEHTAWLTAIVSATANVLELSSNNIFLKRRQRQRGDQQYEKTGIAGEDFIVQENGLRFIVNLGAYLDTGLFLDHRITREMVKVRASDKRFLNLFAYTGSFSVYAAAGGARESVTVDLSNTYQSWTQRNLELNNIDLKKHSLVRADVFSYLQEAFDRKEKFDLIVLDPPSFSNSKKMQGVLDVQRDHAELIRNSMRLLNPRGELFFSTNLRSFNLDESVYAYAHISDVTGKTIPDDFRNKKIHYCFLMSKKIS